MVNVASQLSKSAMTNCSEERRKQLREADSIEKVSQPTSGTPRTHMRSSDKAKQRECRWFETTEVVLIFCLIFVFFLCCCHMVSPPGQLDHLLAEYRKDSLSAEGAHKRGWSPSAYGMSKVACVLLSRILAKQGAKDGS